MNTDLTRDELYKLRRDLYELLRTRFYGDDAVLAAVQPGGALDWRPEVRLEPRQDHPGGIPGRDMHGVYVALSNSTDELVDDVDLLGRQLGEIVQQIRAGVQ